MAGVAVLGYGVVGSGVAQVLSRNAARIEKKAGQPVKLKRVLDLRKFPGSSIEPLLTDNFNDVLNDPDIRAVAEAMGGTEPAFTYVRKLLLAGKHVCTSNKELVARHGAELLGVARDKNVSFLFEASVGGGIPVIRPLSQTLAADQITSVAGILNGTCNYILTHMSLFDKNFNESLAEAKSKGFAERDPSADVEGYDACRKLAILLSLAAGGNVNYEEIHTRGIAGITREDFDFAKLFGYTVKLMGDGLLTPDGVEASVMPMLVHHSLPAYSTHGVYNCVTVRAAMTDDVTFIGRGAGGLTTAAAMVSDMAEALQTGGHIDHHWAADSVRVLPFEGYIKKKLARVSYSDKDAAVTEIKELFGGDAVCVIHENYPGRLAFVTPGETESEAAEKLKRFEAVSVLRVYNG